MNIHGLLCPNDVKPETGTETTTPVTEEGAGILLDMQCMQPRGRFNVEIGKTSLTLRGKTGVACALWTNVQEVICIPKPDAPANAKESEVALVMIVSFKDPVSFGKGSVTTVCIQAESKASITVHSQAKEYVGVPSDVLTRLITAAIGRAVSRSSKNIYVGPDNKTSVACYHGTNQGSLCPLKEGLLFLKPVKFIPKDSIEAVTAGRGGSAVTRYVDLIVEVESNTSDSKGKSAAKSKSEEFTNIDRGFLPALQRYVEEYLTPKTKPEKGAESVPAKEKGNTLATGAIDSDSDGEGDSDFDPSSSEGEDGESSSSDEDSNASPGTAEGGSSSKGGAQAQENEESEEEKLSGDDEVCAGARERDEETEDEEDISQGESKRQKL